MYDQKNSFHRISWLGRFGISVDVAGRRRVVRRVEAEAADTSADGTCAATGADAVEGVLTGNAEERAGAGAEAGSGSLAPGVTVIVDAAELVGDAGATVGTATLFALVSTDTGEGEH